MEDRLIDDCTKLGFGMMRLPRVEGTNTIDLEHTKRMVDAFIKAGGKYFDTAYIYEGSEEATKAALCDRYPRESYYLADKLNGSDFAAKSEEDILQQANPNASFASWAVRFAASLPNVMTLHHLYDLYTWQFKKYHFLRLNARFSVKSLHLALKFCIFALGLHCACQSLTN